MQQYRIVAVEKEEGLQLAILCDRLSDKLRRRCGYRNPDGTCEPLTKYDLFECK